MLGLAHFGVTDEALLDVLTGVVAPTGKMPFELPSSMDAVRAQKEDVPHDSKDSLVPLRTRAHVCGRISTALGMGLDRASGRPTTRALASAGACAGTRMCPGR